MVNDLLTRSGLWTDFYHEFYSLLLVLQWVNAASPSLCLQHIQMVSEQWQQQKAFVSFTKLGCCRENNELLISHHFSGKRRQSSDSPKSKVSLLDRSALCKHAFVCAVTLTVPVSAPSKDQRDNDVCVLVGEQMYCTSIR